MTDGYEVRRGGRTRPGEGQAAARAWLEQLAAATAAPTSSRCPTPTPTSSPSPAGAADLGADVAAARTYGVTVTRDVLGVDPLQSLAVPPPGPLTDAAFDALTTGSTRAVALEDDAVVLTAGSERSTPGARVGPARAARPPARSPGSSSTAGCPTCWPRSGRRRRAPAWPSSAGSWRPR